MAAEPVLGMTLGPPAMNFAASCPSLRRGWCR